MATTVFPLDGSGAPSYTAQAARDVLSAIAGTAPSGRALGAVSGVRSGTPASTGSLSGASNFTWNVGAHSGFIDAEASATAGPYFYSTDGTDTGTVTAANATYPRVDILYVQINDNTLDSSGSESGSVGYLAGTAAAMPVAPATPTRSIAIAQISVPAVGGGNPSITWVAPTAGAKPTCVVYATGTTGITGSTTVVPFDAASINVGGMWTSGANVTIAVPGTYSISAKVSFAASTAWTVGNYVEALIRVNGATADFNVFFGPAGSLGTVPVPVGETVQVLNAGDVVTLAGIQTVTGTLSTVAGSHYTSMSVRHLGP